MCKKLMTTVLVMCVLIIGAKMYPFPVTCTKMKIMETEVILIGDRHSYCDEAAVSFRPQINASNYVLQEWIETLSHSSGETLFLLECSRDELSSRKAKHLLYFERGDTLWFLKELSKSVFPASNLKFKFADRRTSVLKSYMLPSDEEIIMQIIKELIGTDDLARVEAGLWDRISKVVCFSRPGISEWRELENSLCNGHREYFFAVNFPRIKEIFRRLSVRGLASGESTPPSAKELLDDLVKVVFELEECRKGFAPDTFQRWKLVHYLEKINKVRERLEDFFDIYLTDRRLSYRTAFFNSIERTKSFKPYIDLIHSEEVSVEDIILFDIADAGFYIDVLNAIRSGVKRVVLYAGAIHTLNLRGNLFVAYGVSTIIEEIGDVDLKSELPLISIGRLLPPADLRRVLGML